METLMYTSLHVAYKIQAFSIASQYFGLFITLQISPKMLPYLFRLTEGQKGIRVYSPRYYNCYLRVKLQIHPMIIPHITISVMVNCIQWFAFT